MKKKYEEPEMIIDRFEENDGILTNSTSGECSCPTHIAYCDEDSIGYMGPDEVVIDCGCDMCQQDEKPSPWE